MKSNPLMEHALKYALDFGWFVFPTREIESEPFMNKRGKMEVLRPKSPYLAHGFKNCTRDEKQIREWWKRFPNAGVGVSCGDSKIVVIDIDTKDGRKGFENWMRMSMSDEGTFQAMTPSGGMHIIYSGIVNTRANALSGVDIRSYGGYIVAPPSILYNKDKSVIGQYTMVGDWFSSSSRPINFPLDLMEKFDHLRRRTLNEESRKPPRKNPPSKSQTKLLIERALRVIPIEICDDYHAWIKVGLAIKHELGDEGFRLWKAWSAKSRKYEEGICEEKWDKMEPRGETTLGTILFYAYDKSGIDL